MSYLALKTFFSTASFNKERYGKQSLGLSDLLQENLDTVAHWLVSGLALCLFER